VIATLALLFCGLLKGQGQAWTPTGPSNYWSGVAASADGSEIIVGGGVGRQVVMSKDGGATWSTNTQLPSVEWTSVTCSADGSRMLAVSPSTPIYLSTNSGSLWTTSNVPRAAWSSAAMSSDGITLVAIVSKDDPPIFVSTNGGTQWTSNSIIGMPGSTVACSADGSRLMALTTGLFYISTNYGVNWSLLTHVGAQNHNSLIAHSADGRKLAVALSNDGIYTSTNYGMTWTSNTVPPLAWASIACSTDGKRLVAVTGAGFQYNGSVFTSIDAGMRWSSNNVAAQNWTGVASSADGGRLWHAPRTRRSGNHRALLHRSWNSKCPAR
jgi:hypothetical protein